MRKIEETRKKALEIYYLKLKNEEKLKKVLVSKDNLLARIGERRIAEEEIGLGGSKKEETIGASNVDPEKKVIQLGEGR